MKYIAMWGVRLAAMSATAALVWWAAHLLDAALSADRRAPLETVFLVAFVLGFTWIAWSFVLALMGVAATAVAALRRWLGRTYAGETSNTRTALLFPIYNEDVARVFANIAAMRDALAALETPEHFEIFVLSDSRDDNRRVEERHAVASLARAGGPISVRYRHRDDNAGKKAGNIADFVERWGGDFTYMMVLDADSLMRADTIVEMVRRMQARPHVGLLQTAPILMGRRALFGRYLQFASAAFSPSFARGLAIVGGPDSAYWGHNAIIRTRAFAECCGMAGLPGKPPFGGPILSHDFVEAALLRAGGWSVEIAADLEGSYEEAPSDLLSYAIRDRRWAQGNLQHLRVMFARRLTLWGRVSLAQGAIAYLASPLWLGFLLAGLAVALEDALAPVIYFPSDEPMLFPNWDASMGLAGPTLLALVAAMLLTHRLACLIGLIIGPHRSAYGGVGPLIVSFVSELLISTMLAPVMMMLQTRAVIEILIGRDSGWPETQRADGSLDFGDTVRRTAWIMGVGALFAAASATAGVATLLWFSPITLAMLGAPLWVWLTSRADLGLAARRGRIFLTPSERAPEPVIAASRRMIVSRAALKETMPA